MTSKSRSLMIVISASYARYARPFVIEGLGSHRAFSDLCPRAQSTSTLSSRLQNLASPFSMAQVRALSLTGMHAKFETRVIWTAGCIMHDDYKLAKDMTGVDNPRPLLPRNSMPSTTTLTETGGGLEGSMQEFPPSFYTSDHTDSPYAVHNALQSRPDPHSLSNHPYKITPKPDGSIIQSNMLHSPAVTIPNHDDQATPSRVHTSGSSPDVNHFDRVLCCLGGPCYCLLERGATIREVQTHINIHHPLLKSAMRGRVLCPWEDASGPCTGEIDTTVSSLARHVAEVHYSDLSMRSNLMRCNGCGKLFVRHHLSRHRWICSSLTGDSGLQAVVEKGPLRGPMTLPIAPPAIAAPGAFGELTAVDNSQCHERPDSTARD